MGLRTEPKSVRYTFTQMHIQIHIDTRTHIHTHKHKHTHTHTHRHTFRSHLVLPRASLPTHPSHPAPLLLDALVALAAPDTWAQALPLSAANACSTAVVCHVVQHGLLRLLPQVLNVVVCTDVCVCACMCKCVQLYF